MPRQGYFSVLLQGICESYGQFTDIFTGNPGRVHDARMLRTSPFYHTGAYGAPPNPLSGG